MKDDGEAHKCDRGVLKGNGEATKGDEEALKFNVKR